MMLSFVSGYAFDAQAGCFKPLHKKMHPCLHGLSLLEARAARSTYHFLDIIPS
jgi:hypothetical protein